MEIILERKRKTYFKKEFTMKNFQMKIASNYNIRYPIILPFQFHFNFKYYSFYFLFNNKKILNVFLATPSDVLDKKKLIYLINNGCYRIGIFSFFLFTEEKKDSSNFTTLDSNIANKIHEFGNIVVDYVMSFFFSFFFNFFFLTQINIRLMVDNFNSYIWDIETAKQTKEYKHIDTIYCVKFSQYHYHYHNQNVICFSSEDKIICFWYFNNNKSQILDCYTKYVYCIELLSFSSDDNIIRLCDVETSKSLYDFTDITCGSV
ncbi:hypothetical protein RFI_35544, partial [Reticulomyxa filosa]